MYNIVILSDKLIFVQCSKFTNNRYRCTVVRTSCAVPGHLFACCENFTCGRTCVAHCSLIDCLFGCTRILVWIVRYSVWIKFFEVLFYLESKKKLVLLTLDRRLRQEYFLVTKKPYFSPKQLTTILGTQ